MKRIYRALALGTVLGTAFAGCATAHSNATAERGEYLDHAATVARGGVGNYVDKGSLAKAEPEATVAEAPIHMQAAAPNARRGT